MVHASVKTKRLVLETPILVILVVVCVGMSFLAVEILIRALMASVNAVLMMHAIFSQHHVPMEHVSDEV